MNNIAIIPARGGSKRFPRKNVQLLGGIPLIAHSILEAKKFLGLINEVYVSTDDAEIKNIALGYLGKNPLAFGCRTVAFGDHWY
jgi:N-acylneuraminate cytidylyltransferase